MLSLSNIGWPQNGVSMNVKTRLLSRDLAVFLLYYQTSEYTTLRIENTYDFFENNYFALWQTLELNPSRRRHLSFAGNSNVKRCLELPQSKSV
jgi:hypothetical protein